MSCTDMQLGNVSPLDGHEARASNIEHLEGESETALGR